MTRRAEILIIGNEILSGKVADEHSGFLSREFRALGVDLRRVVVLPDEVEAIGEAVREAWQRSDLIVTTGGVGPTHDDVTIAGIAHGLGRAVVRHPELEALVKEVYGEHPPSALARLAEIPEGATLLSAAGLRVPVVVVEKLYVFPGVPEVFRRKFNAIKSRFLDTPFYMKKIYLAVGEEPIASILYEVMAKFPAILLGSYPTFTQAEYRVVLTLESKAASYLEAAHADLVARLPQDAIVRRDEDAAPSSSEMRADGVPPG
ncbi:MAG: competence/damage-inducible protein A [Nitrospirae bacterium]|nr:competence/damage-inducible protein A [Nitrospirota bacterium]